MAQEASSHPLENSWTFWEHRVIDKGNYQDSMAQIITIDSVEGFWSCYSHMPRPSQVFFDGTTRKRFKDRVVDGISLFKTGVRPEWEDPANCQGAEWFLRGALDAATLDEYWLRLLLGLIGETIDDGDEITGARICDKSKGNTSRNTMYRLEVWFRNDEDTVANELRTRVQNQLSTRPNHPDLKKRAHGIS